MRGSVTAAADQVTLPRNARRILQKGPFHIAREDAGAQLPLALQPMNSHEPDTPPQLITDQRPRTLTPQRKSRTGRINIAVQTDGEMQPCIASSEYEADRGRPLIKVIINEVPVMAFIDTGSAITVIKAKHLQEFQLTKRHSCHRILQGISGSQMEVTEEVDVPLQLSPFVFVTHRASVVSADFPGQILVGMDFLRRFAFRLYHEPSPDTSHLLILGCKLKVTFTEHSSLALTTLHGNPISTITSTRGCPLHCTKLTEVPPESARFIKCRVPQSVQEKEVEIAPSARRLLIPGSVTQVKDRYTDVWVVNTMRRSIKVRPGQVITRATPVVEIYATDSRPLGGRDTQNTTEETEDAGWELPSSDLSDEPEFLGDYEDDEFDSTYGTLDFGYEDFIDFPDTYLHGDATAENISEDVEQVDVFAVSEAKLDHLAEQQQIQFQKQLSKYSDLFTDDATAIGTVPGIEHTIDTGDAKPIVTRQWRLPHAAKQTIKEKQVHVNQMKAYFAPEELNLPQEEDVDVENRVQNEEPEGDPEPAMEHINYVDESLSLCVNRKLFYFIPSMILLWVLLLVFLMFSL